MCIPLDGGHWHDENLCIKLFYIVVLFITQGFKGCANLRMRKNIIAEISLSNKYIQK